MGRCWGGGEAEVQLVQRAFGGTGLGVCEGQKRRRLEQGGEREGGEGMGVGGEGMGVGGVGSLNVKEVSTQGAVRPDSLFKTPSPAARSGGFVTLPRECWQEC